VYFEIDIERQKTPVEGPSGPAQPVFFVLQPSDLSLFMCEALGVF
jgi:hypothetical protein